MSWISEHWAEIGAAIAGLIIVADVVVKWTATEKDDRVLERIKAALPVVFPKAGKRR